MKTQILRSTAILGLFFVLAVASVNAQTPSRAEVTIPFDFSAGKANLKAGSYHIYRLSGSAISIRSANGETAAIVSAPLAIGSRDFKAGERLVFNKYGDRYFLSQVWLGVDNGRQLFMSGAETKTAREYKLAAKNGKTERVDVALRK
jgi:hypothetical protein